MIPLTEIVDDNLYCQGDAPFLLGVGFTEDSARKEIREACRNKEIQSKYRKRKYWFTGKAYKIWVLGWFGSEEIRLDAARQSKHALLRQGNRSRASRRKEVADDAL